MNIWKIAPGENAYQWEECRDHGFIGIGWDELGYIRGVSWEEFVHRCQDAYGLAEDSLKSQGVYQLWRFVHEIKVGDRIIANRGTRRIVGIGTITGELFWVKDDTNRHRLTVQWTDTHEYAVDEPGWRKTLIPLSDEKFQELWQSRGNIWKVAPGENASQWAEFQAKKCIGIGWDDMGDIRGLSWEDFAKQAMQTYSLQETQIKTHGVYQIWKFVNDIKPGDQIIANQGTQKIVGIGTVTGESFWVEDGSRCHRLPVKWEQTEPIEIDEPSWVKTLVALSPEKLHQIISRKEIFGVSKIFQEPLTAEFALTQLEALCNNEDVWSSDSFNNSFDKSQRGDYEASPSEYWTYFLDILASSNWQSVEEFFKFYESVGYELLNSLSEEDIPSLFGKDLDEYIVNLTHYGFETLYKRAYEFMKDHPQMAKREITIPGFACYGGHDTNQPLISLIPCAIAYALPTFDDTWPLFQTLGNTPHTSFDEADIEYWCDIINNFGLRQIDITNGDFSGRIYQPKILKELFRMNSTGSIYSLISVKGFLDNDYTPPEIIAAIALAATCDYERLEDEFIDDICDWSLLEMAEEWDNDDRIHLCKGLFTDRGILDHPNCTEEIRNIIEEYLAKQEDETLQLSEICEQVYGEPTALLHCHSEDSDDKLEVKMLFREKRRNWYMEMVITQPKNSKKGFSSHRVSPLFLPLLDSKETQWADLTKEATEEDIEAIDQLFILAHQLSDTNIAFAGADVVGEDVAEAALENFGFYVPDETLLPVFIWWNLDYQLKLIAYFKHPDRFAGEIMIQDDNTNESEVYPSLKKSVARLQQKITYYQEEG